MYECVSTVLSHNDQQYVYSCDELYMTLLSLYFVILCNLIIYALLDIKIQAYITMDSRHFIRQKKKKEKNTWSLYHRAQPWAYMKMSSI